MQYKKLNINNLNSLSKEYLKIWVTTLFNKAKKIQHSEKLHKHDSIFWKRTLSEHVSEERMNDFCKLIDESRNKIR